MVWEALSAQTTTAAAGEKIRARAAADGGLAQTVAVSISLYSIDPAAVKRTLAAVAPLLA
ncbi:hypothetical protein NTGM5_30015 [Candidatus Nitrotoga sp. M5]|nr:hypothetical protein NTGM5_30015 [Candidatus Nitrotoga sp. M5]